MHRQALWWRLVMVGATLVGLALMYIFGGTAPQ